MLENVGCTPPIGAQLSTRLLPAMVLVIAAIAVTLLIVAAPALDEAKVKADIGNVLVAATLTFGIFQWRAALEKDALEKYQAEIKEANEKKQKWPGVKEMMSEHYPPAAQTDPREYQKSQYVYQQLDNLEFAIERYMQGFTSAYTASRAVMTFKSKCRARDFRSRAKNMVTMGSYSPAVLQIVQATFEDTAA